MKMSNNPAFSPGHKGAIYPGVSTKIDRVSENSEVGLYLLRALMLVSGRGPDLGQLVRVKCRPAVLNQEIWGRRERHFRVEDFIHRHSCCTAFY